MQWKALRARASVLFLVIAGGACGEGDDAPGGIPDAPSGEIDAASDGVAGDDALRTGYTTAEGAAACDDLSSATILPFGTFTNLTQYIDLPFTFPLFGEPANRFVMAKQGQIFLGGPLFPTTVGEPQPPPSEVIPNGWVAPFWDTRLTDIPNVRGTARMLHAGAGPDERLVLGYHDFTLRFPSEGTANPDVHLSFQVALYRESGAIELRYCRLDPGSAPSQELTDRVRGGAAGIGLESNDGWLGVSYSFQRPLPSDGISVRFTPAP